MLCSCSLPQVIFDFRFLALLAVAGSLAGSLLCFLNVSVCPYLFLLNTITPTLVDLIVLPLRS
jgi:hypothetical protein